MTSSSKLAQPIEELSQALASFAESFPHEGQNHAATPVDHQLFDGKHQIIEDVLSKHPLDYKVDIPTTDELSSESVTKAESFNQGVAQKTKDWIISFGFQRAISDEVSKYIAGKSDSKHKQIFYNHVSILLDFQAYLYVTSYPFIKHSFYESVAQVSRLLFEISTYEIENFWEYMESRESLLNEKVFDRGVVADRISLLEICNRITDRYIHKTSKGRTDLKSKDSFNDSFQFRVRAFLARAFAFEDNTGLNKYFHVANRATSDFPRVKSPFLEDIIYIQKIFHDPYYYLKKAQYSELNSLVDSIQSVYNYLLSEEVAYQQTIKTDQYAIPKEKSESERALLEEKYAHPNFFPETYWVSSFEQPNKKDLDRTRDEDREYLNEQFSNSRVRLQYLLMIFIIANLYLELTPSNKEDFLVSIGAPANIKHLTDESLSESHKSFFFKIKKELFSTFKTVDNQFAFLLQHMALAEKIWWSWLIYGKDPKTNKSFFVDRLLSQEELSETSETFKKIFPFKEKKYFNTFITPQLTRKMRGTRGLEKLEKQDGDLDQDHNSIIDALNERLEGETDKAKKAELVEERNAIIWKNAKLTRQDQWLALGQIITPEVLTRGAEEKEEAKEEVKEDANEEDKEKDKQEEKQQANAEKLDEENEEEKHSKDGPEPETSSEVSPEAQSAEQKSSQQPEPAEDSRTATPDHTGSAEPEVGSKRPRSDSEEPVNAKRHHV